MPTAPAPILSTTLSSLLKVPAPITMKSFRCFAVIERQGREQRYRFYTAANWKAMQKDQATKETVDDGALSEDELVAEEVNDIAATQVEYKDSRLKRKVPDDGQPSKETDVHYDGPFKRPKGSRVKPATSTKAQRVSHSASEIIADNDAQELDEAEFGYGGMCLGK
jgi:hypothetical protein